jgi:hypothetical protein
VASWPCPIYLRFVLWNLGFKYGAIDSGSRFGEGL